jgi:hypothetical protein
VVHVQLQKLKPMSHLTSVLLVSAGVLPACPVKTEEIVALKEDVRPTTNAGPKFTELQL